jgi:hypothetical protein
MGLALAKDTLVTVGSMSGSDFGRWDSMYTLVGPVILYTRMITFLKRVYGIAWQAYVRSRSRVWLMRVASKYYQ